MVAVTCHGKDDSCIIPTYINLNILKTNVKVQDFFHESNNSCRYYDFHYKDIFCFKAMIVNVICSITDTFEQIFVNLIQYPFQVNIFQELGLIQVVATEHWPFQLGIKLFNMNKFASKGNILFRNWVFFLSELNLWLRLRL